MCETGHFTQSGNCKQSSKMGQISPQSIPVSEAAFARKQILKACSTQVISYICSLKTLRWKPKSKESSVFSVGIGALSAQEVLLEDAEPPLLGQEQFHGFQRGDTTKGKLNSSIKGIRRTDPKPSLKWLLP